LDKCCPPRRIGCKEKKYKKLSKKGVLIGTGIAVAGVAAGVAVSHLIKMMSKH